MKNRIIAILALAALTLSLLAACGSDEPSILSVEEVQQIALEAAGLSEDDITDIHTHVGAYQDTPCYSVHITVRGTEYEYMIHAATGEVLSSN